MSAEPNLRLSSSFRFCPRCGEANGEPGNNPFYCHQCQYTFYFTPVAAVGAIVTNCDGEVLFVVRGKSPGKGMLGLPGGFVDPGETLEASMKREILEETSLTVDSCRYLCSFPNRYRYRGIEVDVTDAFFVASVASFDNLKAQPGEIQSFLFSFPDSIKLERLAFESNRLAVERFLAETK